MLVLKSVAGLLLNLKTAKPLFKSLARAIIATKAPKAETMMNFLFV